MGDTFPRGLYAITPDDADTARLLRRVEAVLQAGVTWLQYRNKGADDGLRECQARELLSMCAHHGVPLIINDDWRLAARIGADGAHLGEDDGGIVGRAGDQTQNGVFDPDRRASDKTELRRRHVLRAARHRDELIQRHGANHFSKAVPFTRCHVSHSMMFWNLPAFSSVFTTQSGSTLLEKTVRLMP